jgi:flagellar P-ring protein precursor FlgI
VNAISAKSLDGGYLLLTPLVGPRPGEPRVYAFAQGPLAMNQTGPTTTGIVHDGCRLEVDFHYSFIDSQDQVNLVIDSNHAGFPTADAIQQAINDKGESNSGRASWGVIAHATSPVTIRVTIPDAYKDSDEGRVKFIATLLDTPVAIQANDARVVVNERNGVIVVGEKVMVGRVAITHKNIAIQTGNDPIHGPLHLVDPMADTSTTRLKALVDALNALKASPHDIIDIIKSLERSGDLYGRLIVE